MKFINYLLIKGNGVPSTAFGVFSVNNDQIFVTPIYDERDKKNIPDIYFKRSLDSDFHSMSPSDDFVTDRMLQLLTRKINNYCNVWLKPKAFFGAMLIATTALANA